MKKTTYSIVGITLIYLLLPSCYQDMGNYDYVDYNKIKIAGMDPAKSISYVTLGDTIKIIPLIRWRYPEKDTTEKAFEFRWELNDSIISTKRNLEFVPIKKEEGAPCLLYVTEKQTGIVSVGKFYITVTTTPISNGWTILSDKEDTSILSYIRRDIKWGIDNQPYYEYVEYKDIYATMYPGEILGKNPKSLFYVIIDAFADEILVCQEPEQCVYLSGDDFSKTINLKDEFHGNRYPKGFIPKDFIDGGRCTYLAGENGEVYWKLNPERYGKLHLVNFIPIPLYHQKGSKISFFPDYRSYGTEMAHMYDVLNNRLLAHYTVFHSTGNTLGGNINFVNKTKPEDIADLNNLNGYKLIYMGGENPNFILILKHETTGDYYYHTYQKSGMPSSLTVQLINHSQEIFAGNSYISENSVFKQLRRKVYLFFSEGSKLYFYDKTSGTVKQYHDFDSGRIVKIAADAPENELAIALDNGDLYICSTSLDVLAAEKPGSEGGILHHTSGLGKIVDVIWKYGGFMRYILNMY